MDNLLRKVESDEVVVYTDQVYSIDVLNKCREIHQKLVDEGKIESDFDSDKWMGYSGVKKFGMDFSMDIILYSKHIGKEFGITADTMKNMLRCYAIYCNGVYVYQTIAREKIGIVKDFLLKYKDKDFKLTATGITTIEDFLGFIGTPDKQIEQIVSNIRLIKINEKSQRELSPIVNYLVIENEINHIYRDNCDDKTFKKWFPIYFWVNITFILPLRATEMLLTPKKCIYRENDKTFLGIRRTRLKKGTRTVYYDVNEDYKEFTYEIPDTEVIRNIARWCRDNIEGLEEVRDYHFTRPIKEKDEKTGKMVERPKRCTLKIEEINKSRSLIVSINTNLLLRASNIDTFMEQPDAAKRKMIVETRETVDKLLTHNGNITRENEALKIENKSMKSDILIMSNKIDTLQKAQDKLIKQVSYLMKATDEATRKEMLAQMGIEDESVDLNTYIKSLRQDLSEVINIDKNLKAYLKNNTTLNIDNSLLDAEEIIRGINFEQ